MSEKRRRYRKIKIEKPPTTILERSSNAVKSEPDVVQPKILLKTKAEKDTTKDAADVNSVEGGQVPQKTIIVTRSISPASISPSTMKEQSSAEVPHIPHNIIEPVPLMTRPSTVISSTGLINASARKLLMKNNTDFLVVGVIGTQGVGKSTIMNLLANEDPKYDYYQKVFVEEDSIFPTKLKLHKCSARSRTESTHMFITSDRMILLDSPPVQCNSYKKDMVTNELDDLRNVITFLSVCHLLIVVQDDYFNMNFMRLLQFAELMKPMQDNRPCVPDYFPNLLFIKNRAKRQDYIPGQKENMDKMLKAFFKDSQLRIFMGQTAEQQRQRKGRVMDPERLVNSFLLPEINGPDPTCYHKPLKTIVEELRVLVFMTPRIDLHSGHADYTEAVWFEQLTAASQDTQHFFFNTYEEIQRQHLEIGSGNSNAKDMHDIWKD